jgi:type IV/VI secretion system ImpK/VasF family protein
MTSESPDSLLQKTLRDTTLYAALLANGAQIHAIHSWRGRCIKLVEDLQQAMRDAQYVGKEIDEVSLVQCVLLDEITLRASAEAGRGEWMREPLQLRFHGTRDSLPRVFERICAAMHNGRCRPVLRELNTALLELVFEGENKDWPVSGQREQATPCVTELPPRISSHPKRLSRCGPICVAMLAVGLAGALWLGWNARLESALKQVRAPALLQSGVDMEKGSPR